MKQRRPARVYRRNKQQARTAIKAIRRKGSLDVDCGTGKPEVNGAKKQGLKRTWNCCLRFEFVKGPKSCADGCGSALRK
nr:hypothetical protein CFP56_57892 [Quercus suber]